MDRAVERRLKLAVAALVFISYWCISTTFQYGTGIMLLPLLGVLLMPIGESLDRRFSVYGKLTNGVSLALLLGLPFIVEAIGLVETVLAVVMYIQIYSLLHVKRERNYNHIILMSFFLLLGATVMEPTAGIALGFAAFVMIAAWALILLEMHVASRRFAENKIADVTTGDRGAEGSAARRARLFDWRLSAFVSAIALGLIVLTGLLFVTIPRTEAGLLGAMQDTETFTTGLSPEVDFEESGFLERDTSAFMRVEFPEETDGMYAGDMLWRSTALDQYTGKGWLRRGLITRLSLMNIENQRFMSERRYSSREGVDRASHERGSRLRFRIFLNQLPEGGVPLLPMVKTVVPSDRKKSVQLRWDTAGDFTVQLMSRVEAGVSLDAVSEVDRAAPQDMRAAGTDYMSVMVPSDYRNLTYQDLLPETLELTERVTENAETPYDKLVALESYLSSAEYEYMLAVPFLGAEHPIDVFIMQEKAGHCELYASALALMARSEGIPTRVVSGFRGGEWSARDEAYTITNDMAHLWVEAYFPGIGWMPFDPSPPAPELDIFSFDGLTREYSKAALRAKIFWLSEVVGFQPEEQFVFLRDRALRLFRTLQNEEDEEVAGNATNSFVMRNLGALVYAAIFAGAASVIFLAMRIARRRRHARKHALTQDQARAVRLYKMARRKLERLGVDCSGLTVEEIMQALPESVVGDPQTVRSILEAYNDTRFGARPMPSSRFGSLRKAVAALRPVSS